MSQVMGHVSETCSEELVKSQINSLLFISLLGRLWKSHLNILKTAVTAHVGRQASRHCSCWPASQQNEVSSDCQQNHLRYLCKALWVYCHPRAPNWQSVTMIIQQRWIVWLVKVVHSHLFAAVSSSVYDFIPFPMKHHERVFMGPQGFDQSTDIGHRGIRQLASTISRVFTRAPAVLFRLLLKTRNRGILEERK